MLENLNLQKIVLIMAVVAFIFAVMVIYYKSLPTSQTKNMKWPPVTTTCPDYWDLAGSLCVNTSGMNKGTLKYEPCSNGVYPCCTEGTCYIDNTTIDKTNKKGWATTNKFVWDGITSG